MTFNNKAFNNRNFKERQEATFPKDYLKGGYFKDSSKKTLRCEYVVEYPKHIVENLKFKDKNKSSQLRKFYDYVIRIKDTIKYDTKTFDEVITEINKLDYYASYAETRGKVTKYFVDFIKENLKNINGKEDFLAFSTHFEAVIAYLPKEK